MAEKSQLRISYSTEYPYPFRTTKKSIQKFSQDVSHYATSQEVIAEFSSEIGPPHEHENEDQFVARAKQRLKQMLKRRFRV